MEHLKETIIQHNSISNAKHDLTTTQMDILFLLIGKIKSTDPTDKVYTVMVKELEKYTNAPVNYKRLREATKELGSRSLEQVYNDGSYDQIWLFSRVKYERGKGLLLIRLSPDIRPYLFDLKRNFTILNLRHILRMRSKFSKRIYQIVCSKRNLGTFTIPLDTLKDRLGVADQYQKFSAFRKYVLDVAEKEVALADVSFTYDTIKQGRRITDIYFTVKFNDKKKLNGLDKKERKLNHIVSVEKIIHPEQHLNEGKVDVYDKCKELGLTNKQIQKIFDELSYKEIARKLYQINLAISDGIVKNKTAYAVGQFVSGFSCKLT
ncbi:replication initiation protein [Chondrinema litorale]|uniref:replication initiation protein n=1 Tax=Chondrinema litorale TaxID=2994555 RepID=UPI0025431A48|nr:replication initiation protein [Chondrinema litorale]UZS00127.1 replication initiation protein [Chondrinema litorale]